MHTVGHWNGFWAEGFWVFPLMMMLIMLVAVFLCARIFLGDRRSPFSNHPGWREPPGESPLEIAERRFARGEISKQEFEQIKQAIS